MPHRSPSHGAPRAPLDRAAALPTECRGAAAPSRPIDPRYVHLLDADHQMHDAELRTAAEERRQRLVMIWLCAFALLWLLLFVLFALSPSATAQRAPSDVEVLARIAVHETGWEDTGDLEAVHAVLINGAMREGITFQAYARRYSSRLMRGEVSRRWAAELVENCTRPISWPSVVTVRRGGELRVVEHARWGPYRDRCLAVMQRARETLAGERTHRCEREPHDWGGRVDRARARRLGLIEVDCSAGDVETVGDYYARPSLVRAELEGEGAE